MATVVMAGVPMVAAVIPVTVMRAVAVAVMVSAGVMTVAVVSARQEHGI